MDFELRWYKALKAHTDALVEYGRNVILVGDFLQSFLDADIWSDKEGSDHAPVFAKMNFGNLWKLQTLDTPPIRSSRCLYFRLCALVLAEARERDVSLEV
ncbi:hypothetical protein BSKO_09643 [Bryopsis sp. KO-2023]|nr:hypothetical protein BSKO_09643 [Bryopsis sp. KO-2023]